MTGVQRVHLLAGANLHIDGKVYRVTLLRPDGCNVFAPPATTRFLTYAEAMQCRGVQPDGTLVPLDSSMTHLWWAISTDAREAAEEKLEIVLEITTGYKDGDPALARPGEPDPELQAAPSERAKAVIIAERLTVARKQDAKRQRRLAYEGVSDQPVGASTIQGWVTKWRATSSIVPLIDGRSLRAALPFGDLDPLYVQVARDVINANMEGSERTAANTRDAISAELETRGLRGTVTEPAQTRYYELYAEVTRGHGPTAKSRQSVAKRPSSTHRSYAPQTLGQVVAIDVTRADNLCVDALTGKVISVEIITAIEVCSRAFLALRVVPVSANAFEAGLILYDILRPFSMLVKGTATSDWRWSGMPSSLVFDRDLVSLREKRGSRTKDRIVEGLQGEHFIPGVRPAAISADNGSIFASAHFKSLCATLGMSLLFNRPGTPTDNPHEERAQGTLGRHFAQILPGFKGSTTVQRGRQKVIAEQPMGTAHDLECALRRGIAVGYHRMPHTGIRVPGLEGALLSPLEMFDGALAVRGAIDLPTNPDLRYDFLPVKWLTINHAGVETNRHLRYDAPIFDEDDCRLAPRGTFRNKDGKAPFMVDPGDLHHLYFRRPPSSGDPTVYSVPLADAALDSAPLTENSLREVSKRLASRGGNFDFRAPVKEEYALAFDGCVAGTLNDDAIYTQFARAAIRNANAARDHADAQRGMLPLAAEPPALVERIPPAPEESADDTTAAGSHASGLSGASWTDERWNIA